jgi:hypothetical protein
MKAILRYSLIHCSVLSAASLAFWAYIAHSAKTDPDQFYQSIWDLPAYLLSFMFWPAFKHALHIKGHHYRYLFLGACSLLAWNAIGMVSAYCRVRHLKGFILTGDLLCGGWLGILMLTSFYALSDTPRQMEKDRKFIAERIKPAVACFEKIESEIGYEGLRARFENKYGLNECMGIIYFTNVDTKIGKLRIPEKSWAVAIWRGEWNEHYLKWSDTYLTNDWGWRAALRQVFSALCIAVVPLSLWAAFQVKYLAPPRNRIERA